MSEIFSSKFLKQKAHFAIQELQKHGAKDCDVIISGSSGFDISVRNGECENTEYSEQIDIGLRAICDKKQAFLSLSNYDDNSIAKCAQRCVEMAKMAPIDEYCAIAENPLLQFPLIPMENHKCPSDLLQKAKECEKHALNHQEISNSYGASASFGQSYFALMTSNGFIGDYARSYHSLSVAVIASKDDKMERDYDYDSKNRLADLNTPEEIGNNAAKLAIKRLGSRPLKSQKSPVIFEQRIANSLLGIMVSAIKGGAISRGVSFLKNQNNQQIFNKNITLTDNPLIPYADGSCSFDGEGLPCQKLNIIDKGILTGFICNIANAKKLDLTPTGHATRPLGAPPGENISNLTLNNTNVSLAQLLQKVNNGLLVSEIFSPQINFNNGDYSVGCSGFLIKNGAINHPVSEITISGNLLEMFLHMETANDLKIMGCINSPSLLIGEMTIAGQT